jgi:hypothetical protein
MGGTQLRIRELRSIKNFLIHNQKKNRPNLRRNGFNHNSELITYN